VATIGPPIKLGVEIKIVVGPLLLLLLFDEDDDVDEVLEVLSCWMLRRAEEFGSELLLSISVVVGGGG